MTDPQNVPIKPDDLPGFIDRLKQQGFYGELSIRFRKGEPMSVVVNQTFLVQNPTLGGTRNHEHPR